MTNVRIDELHAHPETPTIPLSPASVLALRDPTLPSDNTRKVRYDHITSYSVNVLNFGADPTGSADSTAAFQAAIDYVALHAPYPAKTGLGGGTVFIPSGTFKITQIVMHPYINLVGNGPSGGGTVLLQPDFTNINMIVQDAASIADTYIHSCIIKDIYFYKGSGPSTPDTIGSAIYFNSNCGENTKFINLKVEYFPEHGIHVKGAITLWAQDLNLSLNGIYGLYLDRDPGKSFTAHYILGISGDLNGYALVGAKYANIQIFGLKSESGGTTAAVKGGKQPWAVDLEGGGACETCFIYGCTHSGVGGQTPDAVAHISSGPYTVHINQVTVHNGANQPNYLVRDSVAGKLTTFNPHIPVTIYTSRIGVLNTGWVGGVVFQVQDIGCKLVIGSGPYCDPDLLPESFGIGQTNGIGTGTSTNITAPAKNGVTNAPTSLAVNKWVKAQLDGVAGWIPFFV